MSVHDTPRKWRSFRTLATASACAIAVMVASCASPAPAPPSASPAPIEPLRIGDAATDTVGGWLPDGVTLHPIEDASHPILAWLDPALLDAVQQAARAAAAEGVDMTITSGWRSKGFQRRLFDVGVATYGGVQAARRFVASPEESKHVTGEAVDIAPVTADEWLIRNGSRFGLCQIYANEIWHFELVADEQGRCPPLKPSAAG